MKQRFRIQALLALVASGPLALASIAPIAPAQQGSSGTSVPVESVVPIDDQKGRYLNFEVGAIQPLWLPADLSSLWVVNQAGNRLVALDPVTLARTVEIPIGLGGSAVAERPASDELWVVDRVQGCVTVVARSTRAIQRTIQVGAEPHGIAFSPSGDRAWVTCSAVDRVDVIATASYAVVKSIPIPAREPRAIVFSNGRAWVASFLSGNNTAGAGTATNPLSITEVTRVEGPGLNALPDRDLFAIKPGLTPDLDALEPQSTRTGLGTMLLNLHARPDTRELWVLNTEALNSDHRGQKSFVGGQAVSNRITIVDAGGTHPNRVVDLDQIAPASVRCAQPTGLAFDRTRPRAYVCGYGSDLVAVLDILPNGTIQWAGHVNLPPKAPYPRGTAPRACVVTPDGRALYVWNRNDASVARIDLAALPASGVFAVDSPLPVGVGADNTSTEERLGRHLFTDARNSKSKTTSCASCHVDGHTDAIAWDLSDYLDPESTPVAGTNAGLDVKGPLVTQSTRRMEESGPHHWRGEKRSVNDFNQAFVDLMEHEVNGSPATIGPDFQYLRHYVNRLAIPANPRARRDRTFTADEALGAQLFQTLPVLNGRACADCHTLPLGTRGEVVAEFAAGVLRSADVPHLRGVGDKAGPAHLIGGTYGTRAEIGTGLTHAGAYASILDVILRQDPLHAGTAHFQVSASAAQKLASFLSAFDTGLAPATAFQATATSTNLTAFRAGDLAYLKNEARRGHCDVIFFRTPPQPAPPLFARTGMFLAEHGTYRLASRAEPALTETALLAEAAQGRPVTFVGVPLGMGLSHGLDRDMDGAFDVDEMRLGTDPDNVDTDGDRFPDGYEVQYGSNPFLATPTFPQDTQGPALVGSARLVFATTNTIKFEFETTEPTRVHVSYNGGPPVQRIPLDHMVDTEHWVVLNELEPATTYVISLEMRDPAGNHRTDSTTVFSTLPRALPQPISIDSITTQILTSPAPKLIATVVFKSGSTFAQPGYGVHADVFRRLPGGGVTSYLLDAWAPTSTNGKAEFRVPLPATGGPTSTYFFVVKGVDAPAGAPPYVLAYDRERFETIVW